MLLPSRNAPTAAPDEVMHLEVDKHLSGSPLVVELMDYWFRARIIPQALSATTSINSGCHYLDAALTIPNVPPDQPPIQIEKATGCASR